MKNISLVVLLTGFLLTGCSGDPEVEQIAPRAVSYVKLALSEPGTGGRLTGTVESWKREDIGFEVPGRVLSIVEPGVDIEGRTFDEEGNLLLEGTVLAKLDLERYQIAKRQAQTAANAARTELEQVIPKQLEEAEAALSLAEKELQRYANLVASQSASQQELDVRETAQKAAAAKVAQVEALRATKASLLNTALATVEQADVNIADCELTSPFTGQIARLHVIPGGYVLPGQPVVTVQMMDPMKVQVAVAPETDKRVKFNDRVRVYLPDSEDFLEGYVYLKDTYADPATRTYLITLLVRNHKTITGVPEELQGKAVATAEKLWTLQPEKPGMPGNYYVDVNSLQQDEEGYFVWKVEDLTVDDLYESFDPVLKVSKVRVVPGEGRLPSLQVFTFRELTDMGDLDPEKDVVVGAVKGDITDGTVVLVHQSWRMRPGDLAEISLRSDRREAGFYVPRVAIMYDGKTHYLYVVREGSDVAERIDVRPLDTAGQRQRVEPLDEGALKAGDRVIVGGAHYVMEGESVSLAEELEAQL